MNCCLPFVQKKKLLFNSISRKKDKKISTLVPEANTLQSGSPFYTLTNYQQMSPLSHL